MRMPSRRRLPFVLLGAIILLLLVGSLAVPHSQSAQFRESVSAQPSATFPLGTDALGRDRLSRTLSGARMSLLCAPAAAAISVLLALAIGLLSGTLGRRAERAAGTMSDVFLSLPWLFALLAARAVLPLNASPLSSVVLTFGLLGLLGWAGPCRMMMASVKRHMASDFVLLAVSSGCPRWRIALVHVLPNLMPLALAQFLVAVPTYLLAEANLGLLGLGIPEPLASLGGMLKELDNLPAIGSHPAMLAPALLLFALVALFHIVNPADEYSV